MSLKKKSIHMYPWVFYCIYISIYKNVFVWSGIFCDLLRWSECEKMFIFVNERFHLCIYIYRIWSVQKSGIDKCHILCCSLLNGFSMIFTVHEWNVRLQYTSYSFNFWGWEFINCYVSFLVEYIYICMHVLPLDLGDKSFITWVLQIHVHVCNTSTFYCHIYLHVIVLYLCLWRLLKANYMFNVTQVL